MSTGRATDLRIQALVFALVSAAFTSVYVTQPVLPVLQAEFAVTAASASETISAVIAGIAIASLPSGWLADRVPIRRLIAVSTLAALRSLPTETARRPMRHEDRGYLDLVREPRLVALFFTAAGAFCVFSSVFSFFPFYLAAPPLSVSTTVITSMYLTYVVGIFMGPLATGVAVLRRERAARTVRGACGI